MTGSSIANGTCESQPTVMVEKLPEILQSLLEVETLPSVSGENRLVHRIFVPEELRSGVRVESRRNCQNSLLKHEAQS